MILASALACVPMRPAPESGGGGTLSAASLPPGSAAAVAPGAAVASGGAADAEPAHAVDTGQEAFERHVLPILQNRCSPCHFEGGKMYDRLPFDRPGTIRVLGTALFTRIRDEEERQAIREFLGISDSPPEDTSPLP